METKFSRYIEILLESLVIDLGKSFPFKMLPICRTGYASIFQTPEEQKVLTRMPDSLNNNNNTTIGSNNNNNSNSRSNSFFSQFPFYTFMAEIFFTVTQS